MQEILLGDLSINYFLRAVYVYLKKPQVVNRKLSCSSNIGFLKVSKWKDEFKEKLLKCLQKSESKDLENEVKGLLESWDVDFESKQLDDLINPHDLDDSTFISIDRILPRNPQKFQPVNVLTFIHTSKASASFNTINDSNNLIPTIPYEFTFSQESKELCLNFDECSSVDSTRFLKFVLYRKIKTWIVNCSNEECLQHIESHNLINSECYNETYARLKDKYGQQLESNWNESTDPKKFIYEDISIASYLIVLWMQEREKSGSDKLQSFVDLGCGNGLLVYLLAAEGHPGFGIDLRKRKIWDEFPLATDLREMAVVPSDEQLFPEIDWIIGNHSDELSPWIPVISARSSYKSKYFLLPCCAFEFSGKKFQRTGKKSQYFSFIDYLVKVSEACGFEDTKLDRLKIPSTKRICLIGSTRSFDEVDFKSQCEKIQNFINASSAQGNSEQWSESFKPREREEKIKNGSRIDKDLKESITKMIFEHLMDKEEFCDEFPKWNCGGQISLPDAVKLVPQHDLKKLKSECGGLQTLLRNKHQIFHIQGGSIKIRTPKKLSERVISDRILKRNVIKTSPCFFFNNHKQSCPLKNEDCSFKHE